MSKQLEIAGQRFGRWTALQPVGSGFWLCRCDCGTELSIKATPLVRGERKGCRACRTYPPPLHGGPGTRLHNIWAGIIQRCENQNCEEYQYYGARGITVCPEWRGSFIAFRDWAFANGFSENLTIDRRDNNGGYEPSNCRWTTMKVQCRNRRSNRLISWQGREITLVEAAEVSGILLSTLWKRLNLGWSIDRAMTTPVR